MISGGRGGDAHRATGLAAGEVERPRAARTTWTELRRKTSHENQLLRLLLSSHRNGGTRSSHGEAAGVADSSLGPFPKAPSRGGLGGRARVPPRAPHR